MFFRAAAMKRHRLMLPLLLLCAGTPVAADDRAPLPALAARYELRVGDRGTDWYLTRNATRIETFNAGSRQAEIWERGAAGEIEYRRVFLDDSRIVEYSAGELKARRVRPNWGALASVIAPGRLAGLRKTAERTVLGRRAVVLEGRIDGVPARLWWLPGERLPALLEHGRGGTLVRLRLRELHAVPPASWPGMTETRLSGFGTIDAADLGDMEYDPFVRKVMRQDGHVHAHGH